MPAPHPHGRGMYPKEVSDSYLSFLLTELLPEGAAAGPCLLHVDLFLIFSEVGQEHPLYYPVILVRSNLKLPRKENHFLLLERALNTLCLPVLSLRPLRGCLCWHRQSSAFCI